ncbi:MAG: hypothetical protein LC750_07485, partial [Actinobacteria bacterium]|nr:hypothetical protein [Actinomycetota bacterium]
MSPRSGRGGRRQGVQGKSYVERTDLNINRAPTNGTQPLAAPTNLPYGNRKALIDQQRAAPLPATNAID